MYIHYSGYLGTLISKLLSQPERVAKSTVFAISSMVRNMPAALDAFDNLHGYNTLSTKLALSSLGPLQKAILAFYNDLIEQDVQVTILLPYLAKGVSISCINLTWLQLAEAKILAGTGIPVPAKFFPSYAFLRRWLKKSKTHFKGWQLMRFGGDQNNICIWGPSLE